MITEEAEDPRQYLYSSEDDGEVGQIRVEDRGSKFRAVPAQVQGVPAKGVIDTGAELVPILISLGQICLGRLLLSTGCESGSLKTLTRYPPYV